MASYNELLALIDAYINQNGVQAITGQVLNGVLRAMVDQLGRGYSIMGAADPTTDPGTPDGPETWFASVPGTYTNFDGIQIVPGELALLSYVPSTGFSKNTIYEGFQTVQATIDGNVGTPAVGVSYANGILSFDFHNMKGVTGDPAGFGAVTASVDSNIGTPSVQVQTSGPDTAKAIAFQFHNLKGETGVTSVLATVDNTSGNPQCAVSLNGQQLVLNFTGLKGAQGDTGSSVDYPFTIVNNLTTNDATQALSAAMGVQLESEVSQLEAKVTDLQDGETVLQQQIDSIQPVVIEGNVTNAPDNEDITATPDNRLKFADRSATITNKGYKILRADKTFASQVTDINTIYEIRYQFDINGGEVTIPTGCELRFVGGSIVDSAETPGELVLQNTLVSGDVKIGPSVSVTGTVPNDFVTPEMFGAKGDGIADDTEAIRKAIVVSASVLMNNKYLVSNDDPMLVSTKKCVFGITSPHKIFGVGRIEVSGSETQTAVFIVAGNDVDISEITITEHSTMSSFKQNHAFFVFASNNVYLHNLAVKNISGDGFYIGRTEVAQSTDISISDNIVSSCARNGITVSDNVKGLFIRNNHISDVVTAAPQSGIDVEPNYLATLAEDVYIENNVVENDGYNAISLTGCKNCVVKNNDFRGDASFGRTLDGVLFESNKVSARTYIYGEVGTITEESISYDSGTHILNTTTAFQVADSTGTPNKVCVGYPFVIVRNGAASVYNIVSIVSGTQFEIAYKSGAILSTFANETCKIASGIGMVFGLSIEGNEFYEVAPAKNYYDTGGIKIKGGEAKQIRFSAQSIPYPCVFDGVLFKNTTTPFVNIIANSTYGEIDFIGCDFVNIAFTTLMLITVAKLSFRGCSFRDCNNTSHLLQFDRVGGDIEFISNEFARITGHIIFHTLSSVNDGKSFRFEENVVTKCPNRIVQNSLNGIVSSTRAGFVKNNKFDSAPTFTTLQGLWIFSGNTIPSGAIAAEYGNSVPWDSLAGRVFYNKTSKKTQYYDGSAWYDAMGNAI